MIGTIQCTLVSFISLWSEGRLLYWTYLSREVHANMKRQTGIQMAPIWPGTRRASGSTIASDFVTRGWYEKYNHSTYRMTDTTAPTRIPKNATGRTVRLSLEKAGKIPTALLNCGEVVNSVKH